MFPPGTQTLRARSRLLALGLWNELRNGSKPLPAADDEQAPGIASAETPNSRWGHCLRRLSVDRREFFERPEPTPRTLVSSFDAAQRCEQTLTWDHEHEATTWLVRPRRRRSERLGA